MRLDDILDPRAVRHVPRVTSKKRLFCDLAQVAADIYGLTSEEAFPALQEREALGPTGVGSGVALPHARLPRLDRVHGVFFRLDTPLGFDAPDQKPVDLIFALFAPENAGVVHLKALAVVSRTLRDPDLQVKLRANEKPAILYALLTGDPASVAA